MRRFDKHIPILSCLGDWARLRLILAHLSAHRDSEAVPGVDGGQGKHQRNQFLFVEVRSCARSEAAIPEVKEYLADHGVTHSAFSAIRK